MFSVSSSVSLPIQSSRPVFVKHNIGNYNGTKFLALFKSCYDSLPAANSDTSLPIHLHGNAISFPNKRMSFYAYTSRLHNSQKYTNEYYQRLEDSPFPYGYEEEECFSKHKEIYKTGTSTFKQINNRNKYIECVPRKIKISYILKSNTFIVKSFFPNKKENDCFVFFKQNNKLLFTSKDVIRWNFSTYLPKEFTKSVLSHLQKNDTSLYNVLLETPENVLQYRTVLNNSFWKKTSALYLLHPSNAKLKKKVQRQFRNNKYKSILDSYDIPSELKDLLQLSSYNANMFSGYINIYNRLLEYMDQDKAIDQIKYLIKDAPFGMQSFLFCLDYLVVHKLLPNSSEALFVINTHNSIQYNNQKNSLKKILGTLSNTHSFNKKREVIKLGNKTLVINPTQEEAIDSVIALKSGSSSYNVANRISLMTYIFDGIPYNTTEQLVQRLSFSEILGNSEFLVANNFIDEEYIKYNHSYDFVKPKTTQSNLCQEIQLEEDFF